MPLPTDPFQRKRYWFPLLACVAGLRARRADAPETLRSGLRKANGARKAELVREFLRSKVADMLGLGGPHVVDSASDLFSIGFDSLDLIEVAASLSAELGERIPVALFGDQPTIKSYVDNLARRLGWDATAF